MDRANFSLSAGEKADAREALRVLAGSGISLTEAARRALDGRRALKRLTVAQGVDAFLRSRLIEGRRGATVEWYEVRLGQVAAEFGERPMDAVSRADVREWLEGLPTGSAAKAANARAARALWRWALRQDPPAAVADVTVGLKFSQAPRAGAQPMVLTPEECARIMAKAGRQRSALALMLFAGVRPSEVCGKGKAWLRWEHVSVEERWIRIPGDVAKVSGRARIIEGIPEAVWRWLDPGPSAASVGVTHARSAILAAKGALAGAAGRPWEADALRHTFASYALALTDDAAKVAHWLGHEGNPAMLHRHYRGLARKEAAARFFALAPSRR